MKYSEIRYQPEKGGVFLGSPSIVRLPDGALIASHDYFEGLYENRTPRIAEIYRSEDEGQSWQNIYHMSNAFWGTLFVCQNDLYFLCCECEYGAVVIRKSTDGGYSWSLPRDRKSGRLYEAGPQVTLPNWHFGGATPLLHWHGRIYHACESFVPRNSEGWWYACCFAATVISAADDADLLDADNWTMSNALHLDPSLINANHPGSADAESGWLEGNAVEAPDGKSLKMVMRTHLKTVNQVALLDVSNDGKQLSYQGELIDFPGCRSKFTIRRDPLTGHYVTLSNPAPSADCEWARNVLVFAVSKDLRHWRTVKTLLTDESGLTGEESRKYTGFQYTDWQFDGDDIIYAVRMAYRGARNFHDSNRITYHVLKDFRQLIG